MGYQYRDLGMTESGRSQAGGLGMVRNVHESAVSVMLREKAEWEHERARIARILDEFSRAPLSMASVQPILDLAVEMNPRSKETT